MRISPRVFPNLFILSIIQFVRICYVIPNIGQQDQYIHHKTGLGQYGIQALHCLIKLIAWYQNSCYTKKHPKHVSHPVVLCRRF